jgi:multidrug efflux pump subunit AcrB
MRRGAALLATVFACAVAGCGGGGGGHNGFPKSAETNFLTSCEAQAGTTHAYCQCTLTQIENKLPFSEFKQADTALRTGKSTSPKARTAFISAIQNCRSKLKTK